MATTRTRVIVALILAGALAGHVSPVYAQRIEVMPFGGYRFGGGFFEIEAAQPVDVDGAPALGFVFDVPLSEGLAVEGLFTHQSADVFVRSGLGLPTVWRIIVDHWQGGGLQEFSDGAVRPFLTGTLGLTRFATEGDDEIRFTVGAGGGVKLFPVRNVGLRLDGRVFATFVDASGNALACAPGGCLVAVNVHVVWQAEFTAGITIRIP